MKTLPVLFLLLSSCVAWGQDKTTDILEQAERAWTTAMFKNSPNGFSYSESGKQEWIRTWIYAHDIQQQHLLDSFRKRAQRRMPGSIYFPLRADDFDSTLARRRMAFRDSLIVWWDVYVRECYNDSSYGQVPCSQPELLMVCYGWRHGGADFSRFIDFLRRRK